MEKYIEVSLTITRALAKNIIARNSCEHAVQSRHALRRGDNLEAAKRADSAVAWLPDEIPMEDIARAARVALDLLSADNPPYREGSLAPLAHVAKWPQARQAAELCHRLAWTSGSWGWGSWQDYDDVDHC